MELKQKYDMEINNIKLKAHEEYLNLESRIKDTISKKVLKIKILS